MIASLGIGLLLSSSVLRVVLPHEAVPSLLVTLMASCRVRVAQDRVGWGKGGAGKAKSWENQHRNKHEAKQTGSVHANTHAAQYHICGDASCASPCPLRPSVGARERGGKPIAHTGPRAHSAQHIRQLLSKGVRGAIL